jgi:hypothetical protein
VLKFRLNSFSKNTTTLILTVLALSISKWGSLGYDVFFQLFLLLVFCRVRIVRTGIMVFQ